MSLSETQGSCWLRLPSLRCEATPRYRTNLSRALAECWWREGESIPRHSQGIGKIPLTAAKRNIDAALRAAWTSDSRKAQPGPFNQDEDFMFGSPEVDGKSSIGPALRCSVMFDQLHSVPESRSESAGAYVEKVLQLCGRRMMQRFE